MKPPFIKGMISSVLMFMATLTMVLSVSAAESSNQASRLIYQHNIETGPQSSSKPMQIAAAPKNTCKQLTGAAKTQCKSQLKRLRKNWNTLQNLIANQKVSPKGAKPQPWCKEKSYSRCCNLNCNACAANETCDEKTCGICTEAKDCASWDCGKDGVDFSSENCGQCFPGAPEAGSLAPSITSED